MRGFLTGADVVRPVRPEVVASWRRAALVGLEPEWFEPSYDADVERGTRLERAAAPVLEMSMVTLSTVVSRIELFARDSTTS